MGGDATRRPADSLGAGSGAAQLLRQSRRCAIVVDRCWLPELPWSRTGSFPRRMRHHGPAGLCLYSLRDGNSSNNSFPFCYCTVIAGVFMVVLYSKMVSQGYQ